MEQYCTALDEAASMGCLETDKPDNVTFGPCPWPAYVDGAVPGGRGLRSARGPVAVTAGVLASHPPGS